MAANPIDSLQQSIASASVLPTPAPYTPSEDPLARLRQLFRGDTPQSANETPGAAASGVPASTAPPSAIDALVGREVLDLVGSAPLGAEARKEAVRRLVIAMQNPAEDNLRSVLRVLLSGDAEG